MTPVAAIKIKLAPCNFSIYAHKTKFWEYILITGRHYIYMKMSKCLILSVY